MGVEPTQAERVGLTVKRLNHSTTLSNQRSFKGKNNRKNK